MINMLDNYPILAARHDKLEMPSLIPDSTALLLIDLQIGSVSRQYGSCARLLLKKEAKEIVEYYLSRIETVVIPSVQKLLRSFRDCSAEVIFVRIQSLTKDGRDRSEQYKKLGIQFPPYSEESRILESIKPENDEIVISKTSTSAFNSTNLGYVLRNLGIKTLVIGGVISSGCVELNARDASDLGFDVVIAEDACAAWTEGIHKDAMQRLGISYGFVCSTQEIIEQLANECNTYNSED